MPRTEGGVKRRVSFTDDVKDGSGPYTPLAKTKKRTQNDLNQKIVNIWLRQAQSGNYDHLSDVLRDFGLRDGSLNRFFEEEGALLLRLTTVSSKGIEPLKFLLQTMSKEQAQNALSQNNYSIFKDLLYIFRMPNQDKDSFGVKQEKLKLLCSINPDGIEQYMHCDFFQKTFDDSVKLACREKLAECKNNRLSPI